MLYCFHSVADEFEEEEFSGLIVSVDLETLQVDICVISCLSLCRKLISHIYCRFFDLRYFVFRS